MVPGFILGLCLLLFSLLLSRDSDALVIMLTFVCIAFGDRVLHAPKLLATLRCVPLNFSLSPLVLYLCVLRTFLNVIQGGGCS